MGSNNQKNVFGRLKFDPAGLSALLKLLLLLSNEAQPKQDESDAAAIWHWSDVCGTPQVYFLRLLSPACSNTQYQLQTLGPSFSLIILS